MPTVQDLQEGSEKPRMGLIDLVEQHDRVRPAPDAFGEVPGRFIANVAWRRSNEPTHRVVFTEFAHVEADQRILGVKQVRGK